MFHVLLLTIGLVVGCCLGAIVMAAIAATKRAEEIHEIQDAITRNYIRRPFTIPKGEPTCRQVGRIEE